MTIIEIKNNIKITPSQFSKVMALSTGKKGFGKTALTYADEIICKAMGVDMPDITNTAMYWGINHEEEAIKRYEFEYLCNVTKPERITSELFNFVNGLPDGIIECDIAGNKGMIEVKCPYNPTNQLDIIRTAKPEIFNCPNDEYLETYWWQVQGYLWLTGAHWCDFVTYDPRFPESLQMVVQRVYPNQNDIQKLHDRLYQFFYEVIMLRIPQI
jgi:hypothetical protein